LALWDRMNKMKIRKQVYDLTLKDFDEHPVWEFCHGEDAEDQDEATVKPYEDPMPIELGGMMVVCRADFTLADGTEMKGYLYPPMATDQFEMGDLGYIQPHIITKKGQIKHPIKFSRSNTERRLSVKGESLRG